MMLPLRLVPLGWPVRGLIRCVEGITQDSAAWLCLGHSSHWLAELVPGALFQPKDPSFLSSALSVGLVGQWTIHSITA